MLYLDDYISRELRPVYYGRYVDDLLVVINNPSGEIIAGGEQIINKFFVETGIIKQAENDEIDEKNEKDCKDCCIKTVEYKVICQKKEEQEEVVERRYPHLRIQKGKLIFHYYDHSSSWAGLTEFKQGLLKQASEFRFLPSGVKEREISSDAYDINYEGSKNKLRSIIGVRENSTKLAQHFYDRSLRYWLSRESLEEKDIDQIQRFYQGRNIFDYCRTWERVFTLLVSTSQAKEITSSTKNFSPQ